MIRKEHREDIWAFPYVSYTPEKMNRPLPLIVQLHGAGERGDGGEALAKVDTHGFSKYIKDTETECIFIMPQCPENSFWAARVESIVGFIEALFRAYPVDTERVYLTGLSMGGFGTWFTAMARPDLFAAIAPVCGGGMAWNAGVLKMPVWAFHGEDDKTVSVRNSDEMVEALEKQGRDITYTRLAGVGHNAWDYAYNEKLLDWLLNHRK